MVINVLFRSRTGLQCIEFISVESKTQTLGNDAVGEVSLYWCSEKAVWFGTRPFGFLNIVLICHVSSQPCHVMTVNGSLLVTSV